VTAPAGLRLSVVGASMVHPPNGRIRVPTAGDRPKRFSKSVVPESVTQMTEINSWGRGPPVGWFAVWNAPGPIRRRERLGGLLNSRSESPPNTTVPRLYDAATAFRTSRVRLKK
jgi:hypothetical protein